MHFNYKCHMSKDTCSGGSAENGQDGDNLEKKCLAKDCYGPVGKWYRPAIEVEAVRMKIISFHSVSGGCRSDWVSVKAGCY